jgi:MerR family redox-sensitive transcriptional activator SoxR
MWTIGQVAARTGLRTSAIRFYEARGLLPPAPRLGGTRVYDNSVFDRLAAIALAKSAGFSLAAIREITLAMEHGVPDAWKKPAAAKRAALDSEMARLRLMKHILGRLAECSCSTVEECGRVFSIARARYLSRR